MFIATRLASSGWFGGDPAKVLAADVDSVLAAVQYEKFKSDYERKFVDLNRSDK